MNIDIEQLKLILASIEGIGASASTVAIWYFVLQFIGSLLVNLLFGGTLIYITYLITRAVTTVMATKQFYETVAKRLKIYVSSFGIRDDEIRDTQQAILELISKGTWENK